MVFSWSSTFRSDGGSAAVPRSVERVQWQVHDEFAAAAESRTVDLNAAAVHLGDPANQRQTDPQPRATNRARRPPEEVKDVGQRLRDDADPAIAHPHEDAVPCQLDRQPDVAA